VVNVEDHNIGVGSQNVDPVWIACGRKHMNAWQRTSDAKLRQPAKAIDPLLQVQPDSLRALRPSRLAEIVFDISQIAPRSWMKPDFHPRIMTRAC
jgi:hypothetical protein